MTSITQLLREADEALYEAKGRGRNCCVAQSEPSAPVAVKLKSA